MMKRAMTCMTLALALAGCAMTPPPEGAGEPQPRPDEIAQCDAALVQPYVGEKATEETGAAILTESGARGLRWGPPRSAWTMDFRPDRVNVRYDDAMIITDITCG